MTEVLPNRAVELPENYTKVCKTCNEDKPASEYYDHNTNFDRLFHDCKKCANEKRRAKHHKRREIDFSGLDRVQQFVQGYLDPSELSDDEVVGSFIRDSNGNKVESVDLRQRFHAKFQKELGRRINNFIRSKAPNAVEIIYQIAANDLYEAADRLKAATWLAERVIGKTPDVLITAQTDAPFVGILASLAGGSREAYRQDSGNVIELTASESTQDAEIIDAETVDETGNQEESDEVREANGVSSVDDDGGLQRSRDIQEDRKERLEAAKRIRKAKQRRFAARAIGATSLSDQPWLCEFLPIRGSTKYKLRLIPPHKQTPAIVSRLMEEKSWEPLSEEGLKRRRAQAYDEQARDYQAKLDRLERSKITKGSENGEKQSD